MTLDLNNILTIISIIISFISLIYIIRLEIKSGEMKDDVWDLIRTASTFISLEYIEKNRNTLSPDDMSKINAFFKHSITYRMKDKKNIDKEYFDNYNNFIDVIDKRINNK